MNVIPSRLLVSKRITIAQKVEDNWLDSPDKFAVHYSRGAWVAARHLRYLAAKVAQCAIRPIFLIVTLPPRHGKSQFISHWTPLWFLKRYPWRKVGLASYESSFAQEWGGMTKDSLVENSDELELTLTTDTKSKGNWRIKGFGGGMTVAGIGGPITGRGFHLFIIDDPIKNDQEALSATYRENLWRWYRTTARTRLEPGGSMIIIMSRWHEDDLVGKLTGPDFDADATETGVKDPWEIINLPALAEDSDALGRRPGEALWPERYDEQALANIRASVGPFWFASLFQGRPQPEGGGIIKVSWFKRYSAENLPKRFSRVIQIWDTAFKEGQQADRSACITIGETPAPARYFILDLFVRRLEFPELVRAANSQYEKWHPDRVLIEDKASGISLIQQIRRDSKVPIHAIKAVDDKVTRAHTVTGIIEIGRVFLPETADWLLEFLGEVGDFPRGTHDDIPDVLVHGLRYLKPRLTGLALGVATEGKTSRWRE